MAEVWKYSLTFEHKNIISMPPNAEILTVQLQEDRPVMWAKVFPPNQTIDRTFLLAYTGEILPNQKLKYIGTLQRDNGLVYHVFEKLEENKQC